MFPKSLYLKNDGLNYTFKLNYFYIPGKVFQNVFGTEKNLSHPVLSVYYYMKALLSTSNYY